MNENIILDITDVVEEQKKSRAKRFKVSVLVISLIVLATLTVVAWYNVPEFWPLVAIAVAIFVSVATYSIPGRRERKFMKPYIEELEEELNSRGYKFADSVTNKRFKPWFSSQSAYLYGDGLVLRKSLDKGLKMRTLKFTVDSVADKTARKRKLTVERLMSGQSTLIKVISADKYDVLPRKILKPGGIASPTQSGWVPSAPPGGAAEVLEMKPFNPPQMRPPTASVNSGVPTLNSPPPLLLKPGSMVEGEDGNTVVGWDRDSFT